VRPYGAPRYGAAVLRGGVLAVLVLLVCAAGAAADAPTRYSLAGARDAGMGLSYVCLL